MPNNETKVLDEDGAILLTSDIKTLADATYPQLAAIANTYDPTAAYSIGDYCMKNGLLYRCTIAVNAGGETWDPTHWNQIQLTNEYKTDFLRISEQIPALTSNQILQVFKNQGWTSYNWATGTLTLIAGNWTETEEDSGIYTQNVTISGSTNNSTVTLYFTATILSVLNEVGITKLEIINTSGTLTAVATGGLLETDLSIDYRISKVS